MQNTEIIVQKNNQLPNMPAMQGGVMATDYFSVR